MRQICFFCFAVCMFFMPLNGEAKSMSPYRQYEYILSKWDWRFIDAANYGHVRSHSLQGEKLFPLVIGASEKEKVQTASNSQLSVKDILRLKALGFSDAEIKEEFAKNKSPLKLSDTDVTALKKAGIGDSLIAYLKNPIEAKTTSKAVTKDPKKGSTKEDRSIPGPNLDTLDKDTPNHPTVPGESNPEIARRQKLPLMGPLQRLLPKGGEPNGVWSARYESEAYVLENEKDSDAIRYFYVGPREGQAGRRKISVKVWGNLGEGNPSAGAGLIYALNKKDRSYYLFVLHPKGSVAMYRRGPRGLKRMLKMSSGKINQQGYNELQIVERGKKFSMFLNGSQIFSLQSQSAGRGATGIVAMGTGRFQYTSFQHGVVQPKAVKSLPVSKSPPSQSMARVQGSSLPPEILGSWVATVESSFGSPGELVLQFSENGNFRSISKVLGREIRSSGKVRKQGNILIIQKSNNRKYTYQYNLQRNRLFMTMPEFGGVIEFTQKTTR